MQWRGAEVDPDGMYPEPNSWTPVEVPGRPEEFAGADAVAYRTTLTESLSEQASHAVLELRGCYGETTVWCDGVEVATHAVPFAPLRVPLDEYVDGETDIRVVCRRPADGFAGIYGTDEIPATDVVPGIWWATSLRTYPGTYIDQVQAMPSLDGEKGTIDVRAEVVADEPIDDRVTMSLRPAGSQRGRGMMERAPIEADAGERVTVEHTIEVRDPALWWPADLGAQNRYELVMKFDGMEKTVSTGFCDVRFDGDAATINGTETTLRGVNLLDATPEDVRRAAEANANLVRTRAHVPSRDIVRACNEKGLLLWVGLPLSGAVDPDVDRGQVLATALGRHYGRAPSLAAVGVHDSPVSPFESPLGSGLLDRLRYRYRTWRASYDDSNARAIADALPSEVASFPVIGPPGIEADATTLYPGWQYLDADDLAWVLGRIPDADVVAGFGAGSLAVDDPEEIAGFDRRTHDTHVDGGVEESQRYQATIVKRVAEGLRKAGASVLAASALRDAGDAGMGVLAADGQSKRAFDALATAFEPVQATLTDPTGPASEIVVHNDLNVRFTGTLTWESPTTTGETDVAVGTNSRATITTIDLPEDGSVRLRLSSGDRVVENRYDI